MNRTELSSRQRAFKCAYLHDEQLSAALLLLVGCWTEYPFREHGKKITKFVANHSDARLRKNTDRYRKLACISLNGGFKSSSNHLNFIGYYHAQVSKFLSTPHINALIFICLFAQIVRTSSVLNILAHIVILFLWCPWQTLDKRYVLPISAGRRCRSFDFSLIISSKYFCPF